MGFVTFATFWQQALTEAHAHLHTRRAWTDGLGTAHGRKRAIVLCKCLLLEVVGNVVVLCVQMMR